MQQNTAWVPEDDDDDDDDGDDGDDVDDVDDGDGGDDGVEDLMPHHTLNSFHENGHNIRYTLFDPQQFNGHIVITLLRTLSKLKRPEKRHNL